MIIITELQQQPLEAESNVKIKKHERLISYIDWIKFILRFLVFV